MHPDQDTSNKNYPEGWLSVFLIFLRLGMTSFGGPIAHLGYFREEFITRRRWLSEHNYADLVAFCQFLPGPASSQLGMALGMVRSGPAGALAAWAGFTLPSAVMLYLFSAGLSSWGQIIPAGALHGLKIVAVAVVAQAVWGMARILCTDATRIAITVTSACIALLCSSAFGQIGLIIIAALSGIIFVKPTGSAAHEALPATISQRAGATLLCLFFGLLFGLPVLLKIWPSHFLAVVNAFYRTGSLVFGGGHVVLPLLQAAVVPVHWVNNDIFLAGYGIAQAVPGPLFTFAAFLGGSMNTSPNGWVGALVCLLCIFLPSFLFLFGAMPFWEQLRSNPYTRQALAGINSAVAGLLLAALYQPVWSSAIFHPADAGLALIALIALMFYKLPPWLLVLGCSSLGWLLSMIH